MPKHQIIVAQLPSLLPEGWQSFESLAIVIDTLRFTSTACQALAAGAQSIRVAQEVDEAKRIANEIGPDALLCGERHCRTIDGFDLGNSPLEFTSEAVGGKQLVFSTTNGTRAVLAASKAKCIALGSLLNRTAVSKYAYQLLIEARDVERIVLVCAGTDGEIAAEDVLTAGAIVQNLVEWIGASLANGHDSSRIARDAWRLMFQRIVSAKHPLSELTQYLEKATGGQNLIEAGFNQDIAAVSKLDSLSIVPLRTGGGFRFESGDKFASK